MLRRVLGLSILLSLVLAPGLHAQEEGTSSPSVLEVNALDYAFQTSTTEAPSGWTTFQIQNKGEETHVLELARLPEGVDLEEFGRAYGTFDSLAGELQSGAIDSVEFQKAVKRQVPSWVFSLDYRSGPGFLAPGATSTTTVRLEPGIYVMACSIKNREGTEHFRLGMLRPLTVTETEASTSAPEADATLRAANYEFRMEGELSAGRQTVAVHLGERSQSMEAPYQDVHLVRLDDDTSVEQVTEWMRTRETPAPADFMGGASAAPAGQTVYLTVDLEPGQYAWVSQASEPKGMVKQFTVR